MRIGIVEKVRQQQQLALVLVFIFMLLPHSCISAERQGARIIHPTRDMVLPTHLMYFWTRPENKLVANRRTFRGIIKQVAAQTKNSGNN